MAEESPLNSPVLPGPQTTLLQDIQQEFDEDEFVIQEPGERSAPEPEGDPETPEGTAAEPAAAVEPVTLRFGQDEVAIPLSSIPEAQREAFQDYVKKANAEASDESRLASLLRELSPEHIEQVNYANQLTARLGELRSIDDSRLSRQEAAMLDQEHNRLRDELADVKLQIDRAERRVTQEAEVQREEGLVAIKKVIPDAETIAKNVVPHIGKLLGKTAADIQLMLESGDWKRNPGAFQLAYESYMYREGLKKSDVGGVGRGSGADTGRVGDTPEPQTAPSQKLVQDGNSLIYTDFGDSDGETWNEIQQELSRLRI